MDSEEWRKTEPSPRDNYVIQIQLTVRISHQYIEQTARTLEI